MSSHLFHSPEEDPWLAHKVSRFSSVSYCGKIMALSIIIGLEDLCPFIEEFKEKVMGLL